MSIIDITKQYIASDSIMARPTNKVRVMVDAASGCWATEFNAEEMERVSPKAGIMLPNVIVAADAIIDTIPTNVMLSISFSSLFMKLGY